MVQYRTAEFEYREDANGGNGSLSGTGCRVGAIEPGYQTIVHPNSPCFQRDRLKKTVDEGHFLKQHSRTETIGFFNSAQLVGRDFKIELFYYSTDDAQRERTKHSERKQAGKKVALSNGFTVMRYEWFENGESLLAMLKTRKEDLKLWDVEDIRACNDYLAIMYVDQILETSSVISGGNEPAEADEIRTGEVRGFDRAAEGEEYSVLSVCVKAGEKITVDELLSGAREMGILDERTVEEIAAEGEDPEPPKTVDGTARFAAIDELLARKRSRN